MKNKNKYKATVKSKRQDYTKGGRVGYANGQMVDGEYIERGANDKTEAEKKAAEAAKKAQDDAVAAQAKAAQKVIDDEAARLKAIADKEAEDAEALRQAGLTPAQTPAEHQLQQLQQKQQQIKLQQIKKQQGYTATDTCT
jgi:hypothetical protein